MLKIKLVVSLIIRIILRIPGNETNVERFLNIKNNGKIIFENIISKAIIEIDFVTDQIFH